MKHDFFDMNHISAHSLMWEAGISFGAFEMENPRLAAKFVRTVDAAYSNFSWMKDNAFRQAISDALDDFFGVALIVDIY